MPAELDHSVSGKKRQRLASRITAVVCKHAGNCISALSDIKKKKKEPHIHAPQWALKKKKKNGKIPFFFQLLPMFILSSISGGAILKQLDYEMLLRVLSTPKEKKNVGSHLR